MLARRFFLAAIPLCGMLALLATAQEKANETPVKTTPKSVMTQDGGRPVGNNQNTRTAGPNGPALLDNFQLIERLARFDRERIPERVVHARGVGAHGEFVSYDNFSEKTAAKLFSEKGKKTPVFVRFSLVIPSKEGPESLRDPRGFSVKFYTEEGNWDLVGNNLPVFFIRDSMKFPDLIHAFKPSPITNIQDPHRIFDFLSHVPESTHMITFLWSDRGTPRNYREQDGFGVNTFKWVNASGKSHYVRFNWRSMQGVTTYTQEEANQAGAKNHSFATADLYDNIKTGRFPSWELKVQLLAPEQADALDFDPLDATKVWPNVPEVAVGKMTLNRVPDNFFQFTEQVAFDPGVLVPGIEASEDKLLQGRLFSYSDTQRYRIGANYQMLPVNKPAIEVVNHNQDGKMNFARTKTDINYEPSIDTGSLDNSKYEESTPPVTGNVVQRPIKKQQNFAQAGELYRSFDEKMKASLINNLAMDLQRVRSDAIRNQIIGFCYVADQDYGTRLATALKVDLKDIKALIKQPAETTQQSGGKK